MPYCPVRVLLQLLPTVRQNLNFISTEIKKRKKKKRKQSTHKAGKYIDCIFARYIPQEVKEV